MSGYQRLGKRKTKRLQNCTHCHQRQKLTRKKRKSALSNMYLIRCSRSRSSKSWFFKVRMVQRQTRKMTDTRYCYCFLILSPYKCIAIDLLWVCFWSALCFWYRCGCFTAQLARSVFCCCFITSNCRNVWTKSADVSDEEPCDDSDDDVGEWNNALLMRMGKSWDFHSEFSDDVSVGFEAPLPSLAITWGNVLPYL